MLGGALGDDVKRQIHEEFMITTTAYELRCHEIVSHDELMQEEKFRTPEGGVLCICNHCLSNKFVRPPEHGGRAFVNNHFSTIDSTNIRAEHGVSGIRTPLSGRYSCSNPDCPAVIQAVSKKINRLNVKVKKIKSQLIHEKNAKEMQSLSQCLAEINTKIFTLQHLQLTDEDSVIDNGLTTTFSTGTDEYLAVCPVSVQKKYKGSLFYSGGASEELSKLLLSTDETFSSFAETLRGAYTQRAVDISMDQYNDYVTLQKWKAHNQVFCCAL